MRKEANEKRLYIDRTEKKYSGKISRLQSRLLQIILDYFSTELVVRDGIVRNVTKNISTARKINIIQDSFMKDESEPLMRYLAGTLIKLHKLNTVYFNSIPEIDNGRIREAQVEVLKKQLNKLGFDRSNSRIIKNGFLYDAAKVDSVFTRVKIEALRSAYNEVSLSEFRSRIDTFIKEDRSVENHFRRLTGDIYSQFERESSNQTRKFVGLQFALYAGGTIGTTRDFCKLRNNKVFHESEIEKFGTSADAYGGYSSKPDFQGKTSPYDPFSDLGGHNCRHSLDWISDRLALRLRPDARKFLENNDQ
jgi:hypothetical protein